MSKQIMIKPRRATREDINIINASTNEGNINSFKRLMADSYYQGKTAGIIEGAISAAVGVMLAISVEYIVESAMLRKKKKRCEDELANFMNGLIENEES